MNRFRLTSAKVIRVFTTDKSESGEMLIGLEVIKATDEETGRVVAMRDRMMTRIGNFERIFGFFWENKLKSSLIGSTVYYERSLVKAGEEFITYEGSEDIQAPLDEDRVLHLLVSVDMPTAKVGVLDTLTEWDKDLADNDGDVYDDEEEDFGFSIPIDNAPTADAPEEDAPEEKPKGKPAAKK